VTTSDPRSWAEDAFEAARSGAEAFWGVDRQATADGIRSAFEATQRLGELFTQVTPFGGSGEGGVDEEAYRRFRAESERMFDAWMDVMRSSFATVMAVADRAFLTGFERKVGGEDAVRFAPVLAGESTSTTMWVRNPTDSPLVGVGLTCSPLVSDSGDLITSEQIVLSPSSIDVIEAQDAYAVSVRLETRPEAASGVYRGAITSEGLPNALVVAEIVRRPQ
jgi:hypothetical protein